MWNFGKPPRSILKRAQWASFLSQTSQIFLGISPIGTNSRNGFLKMARLLHVTRFSNLALNTVYFSWLLWWHWAVLINSFETSIFLVMLTMLLHPHLIRPATGVHLQAELRFHQISTIFAGIMKRFLLRKPFTLLWEAKWLILVSVNTWTIGTQPFDSAITN